MSTKETKQQESIKDIKQKEIVVLYERWHMLGVVEEFADGSIIMHDAYNIRRWGTTAGLGELAVKGPTSSTTLDYYGEVRIPAGQCVFRIKCFYDKPRA